jgi:hypothetical protein
VLCGPPAGHCGGNQFKVVAYELSDEFRRNF